MGTAALEEWIPVARVLVALSQGCCPALVPQGRPVGAGGARIEWNFTRMESWCAQMPSLGLSIIYRWRRWPAACSFEKARSWVAFGTWHAGGVENHLLKKCSKSDFRGEEKLPVPEESFSDLIHSIIKYMKEFGACFHSQANLA